MPNAILDHADGWLWDGLRWWATWTDHDTLTTRALPLPAGWDSPLEWR